MDSVTQLVLGSTVAHSIGGKNLSRKAIVWGAFLGTLPDLDVLLSPFLNDMEELIIHRGFSHSLFWQTLFSPLMAAIICTIHRQWQHYWRWFFICLLAFWTHSLIDWFTIYGTKVLLPFDDKPYSLNNLFIIDPIITITLLLAFVWGLFKPNNRVIPIIALLCFASYSTLSIVIQHKVTEKVSKDLLYNNIYTKKFFVSPTPFNIVWWRAVAVDNDRWYEGTYSIWHGDKRIIFKPKYRNLKFLKIVDNSWSYGILKNFSKGFYKLDKIQHNGTDLIQLTDLRMGFDDNFFFKYNLAQWHNNRWNLIEPAYHSQFITPENLSHSLKDLWLVISNQK